jgi:glucose-1-phosphate adenylyltransferase
MPRPKILTLILAGGAGSRLEVLTMNRAKPVVPFGGNYRIIDFVLSNCLHSGLTDVWVIEQYQLHSLNDHLNNGRPWDLDRNYGGLLVLPPYTNHDQQPDDEGGFAEGNADAIWRHVRLIREFAPDILLVLSADHIYTLDYRDVIEAHLASKAAVTMVTTEVAKEEAGRFGVVTTGRENRVTRFDYKPEKPVSNRVTAEVFVYDAPILLQTLEQLVDKKPADGKTALQDFGDKLLPEMVKQRKVCSYSLQGYWRDVGTVESYWRSHQDLLEERCNLQPDNPQWPILTYTPPRLPARIYDTAKISNSFVSGGSTVRGKVVRSVIGPGVVIEAGATVRDSILLGGVRVGQGASVDLSIIDTDARIGEETRVGKRLRGTPGDKDITMIGQNARIKNGARVAAGTRIDARFAQTK